jgi:lipopolysaccharide biosynthesis protein
LRAIERKAFPAALELTQPAEATEARVSIESESSLVDASSARINPLAHYLQDGWHKGALAFDPVRLLAGMKIAVIVHLFYPDLWAGIAGFLHNIPIEFDLFVSLPRKDANSLRALVLHDRPQAQILEVPNSGRDVGAFFAVLPQVLSGKYAVLCKLHSKKGLEYPEAWRDLLLCGLLSNKILVTRILHAFAGDPELALVGARQVYLSGATQITQNRDKLEEITQLLCPGRSLPDNWGFFAGTMFWARPDFFRPFAQIADRLGSFETTIPKATASSHMRSNGCLAPLQHCKENVSV